MKITLESTTKVVTVNPGTLETGVQARIWEGKTESGIKVVCLVTRIGVSKDADPSDIEKFNNELIQCKEPSAESKVYPLSLII